MSRIIFFTVFFLISGIIHSQEKQKFAGNSRSVIIRTNPGSFLEHEAGIMLGIGYRWSPRYSATFDPMFIFYKPYPDIITHMQENATGIKIKSDFRYHINRFLGFKNVYIAPDFHYKNVVTKRWETFGMNCIQGQCDYYMNARYRQVLNELGAAIKGGIEVFSNNDQWYIELYGGLGFKFSYYKEKGIPAGGSFSSTPEREAFFGMSREGVAYPNMPIGVKLGYRIY